MKEYTFTEDEIKVVSDYLFRKICRLEDAGLEDSYCYPRLVNFRRKLLGGILDEDSEANEKISK